MFLVRLSDSKKVVAKRRTESAAQSVIDRRSRSCPARFEIVPEAPARDAKEAS
jgi:hypothetical protein